MKLILQSNLGYYGTLSLTSVVAMHTCNCSLTTVVNLNIIDRFFPENNNPRQVTIQVEYGGTADYTTADIRDSMSIACGDGLGYTYCGNR